MAALEEQVGAALVPAGSPLPAARRSVVPVLTVIGGATVAAALATLAGLHLAGVAVEPWAPVLAAAGAVGLGFLVLAIWRLWHADRFHLRLLEAEEDGSRGLFVIAADGRVLHGNQAIPSLVERPPRHVRDMAAALGDGEEVAAHLQRLTEAAAAGGGYTTEIETRQGDRRTWWVITAAPLARWPGHLRFSLEEVTARRQLELVLREEQVKLVDFMDHAPVGFYSVDAEGRFLFVNATLAEWLGLEAAQMVRRPHHLHDILINPPSDTAPFALTPSGEDLSTVTVLIRGRGDTPIQASIDQTVVRGEHGEMLWTRSVVRDLTPEREMREALRASEDRFERFFKDAPIGVALVAADGRLDEWNTTFAGLVAGAATPLQGTAFTDFVVARERTAVQARLMSTIGARGDQRPLEVRLVGADEPTVLLYPKRLDGTMNEPARLLLHVIDQTTQKNLEAQFVQSQKMQAVGQLAGGIAHDFNNLLTAMIGFCDLLLLRHKPGDPSFADIMQIKQNANRGANLVRQLLAFSRQQTLQPRVLNVTDTLAELSNLLRRLIGETIELKMVHGRNLWPVRVDQGQLEQTIINLAVNARDAIARDGQVTISTGNVTVANPRRRGSEEMAPGDYVAISVEDTGVGIPPENIDRIFDPFFSTKSIGSGTGLGLSTVYGIVRQTGGFVFVDSEPGKGARFTIYLPRHVAVQAEAASASVERQPARDLTGAERILLVEDEDAVRMFSARALRNKGYEVLEAENGEVALEILTARADELVDLLITDVVMPSMDGPALIAEVRQRRPGMRVICISGYAEDRYRDRIGDDEQVHFLAKPFSLKQLAAKVKDVLRGPE